MLSLMPILYTRNMKILLVRANPLVIQSELSLRSVDLTGMVDIM